MKGVNLTHLDDHLYHCYLDFSVDHYTTQTTEKYNTVMCLKVSLDQQCFKYGGVGGGGGGECDDDKDKES